MIAKIFYRLFIYVLPLEIQLSRGEGGGPIKRFNLVHICCVCPKPGTGFPTSYVVVFFEFKESI
jgi:hypothetical protein